MQYAHSWGYKMHLQAQTLPDLPCHTAWHRACTKEGISKRFPEWMTKEQGKAGLMLSLVVQIPGVLGGREVESSEMEGRDHCLSHRN